MTTPHDNTSQDLELTLDPETIDDLDPRADGAIGGAVKAKPECTRAFTGC